MDKNLETEYKHKRKIDKLVTKKSELTKQIKNTPPAHRRKREALQQERKEVSKELRTEKIGNYTALTLVNGLKTPGEATHVANAMANKAKKTAPGSKVTTITGENKDVGRALSESKKSKQIEGK